MFRENPAGSKVIDHGKQAQIGLDIDREPRVAAPDLGVHKYEATTSMERLGQLKPCTCP